MSQDPPKYFRVEVGELLDELGEVTLELERGATSEAAVRHLREGLDALRATLERDARDAAQTKASLGEALARKDKELESLSYSVAHDLRAPLRSLDGFSQALLEDYAPALDEQGREYLHRVQSAARRMGALIDDLLELSRVCREELRRERARLSEIAHAVSDGLRREEPERLVSIEIQPGLDADADPRLLRVVFDQLLGNAWKFTSKEPRGRITFGREERNGRSAYFVRDNGVGFDLAHAGKLFTPFQRLHPSADFPGTGIGLAIVHRVIERHGGTVWAESAVGAGATIFFTLPDAREEAAANQSL